MESLMSVLLIRVALLPPCANLTIDKSPKNGLGTHLLSGCCCSANMEALQRVPRPDLATSNTGVARPGPLSIRSGRGGEFLALDEGRKEAETHLCQARGRRPAVMVGGGRSWCSAPLDTRRRWLLSDLGGGVGLHYGGWSVFPLHAPTAFLDRQRRGRRDGGNRSCLRASG